MNTKTKQIGPGKWRIRPAFTMLALVATAAMTGGFLVAFNAYASGHHMYHAGIHRSRHGRLGVFSHPLKRAHAAYAGARELPMGSALAEMFGSAEVYVSEEAGSGVVCLSVIEAVTEGRACGRTSEVQSKGMVTVGVFSGHVRVGTLLPNGIDSVTLTDRDGVTHRLSVTNNVTETYDANVGSVQYQLPGGVMHAEKIPAAAVSPSAP